MKYLEMFYVLLHLSVLLFTLWNVHLVYGAVAKWVRGKIQSIEEKKFTSHLNRLKAGLGLMLLTGYFAFWMDHAKYMERWQFHLKVTFVFLILINTLAIGRILKGVMGHSFKAVPSKQKLPILLLVGMSLISWAIVLISAGFIKAE